MRALVLFLVSCGGSSPDGTNSVTAVTVAACGSATVADELAQVAPDLVAMKRTDSLPRLLDELAQGGLAYQPVAVGTGGDAILSRAGFLIREVDREPGFVAVKLPDFRFIATHVAMQADDPSLIVAGDVDLSQIGLANAAFGAVWTRGGFRASGATRGVCVMVTLSR
jgi:hypothetical protein